MEKSIEEKNIIIAKWLGWVIDEKSEIVIEEGTCLLLNEGYCSFKELKFDKDSNFQWVCLEKISKKENISIDEVFAYLSAFKDINSKLDLFEEIVLYVNRKNLV